jgi:ATP-dependent Clp protease ATP-binding subunit ClpC
VTEPLGIDTWALVRTLEDGRVVAHAVANPSLAAFGAEADALSELRLFLSEWLDTRPAVELARHHLPEGLSLVEVEVELPREDLPKERRFERRVHMPCVVIPHREDRWVVVPMLGQTLHVSAAEPLEETLARELRRLLGAMKVDGRLHRALLPAVEHRLERLEVQLSRGAPVAREAVRSAHEAARKKALVDAGRTVLDEVGSRFDAGRVGRPRPALVAREAELDALVRLLEAPVRSPVLLVGEALSGKTAILEAWLHQRARARRPVEAWATSGARLIAGMSGFGQWQERVRRVMDAAEALDAVLYLDDLGDLFGEAGDGRIDIPGAMKPYLERRRVRLVAEVTPELLERLEARHVGFLAAFHRVRVPDLGRAEATAALEARVAFAAEHEPDRPAPTAAAVPAIVELCERYLPYHPFPGKAVRLYEDVRASAEHRLARGAPAGGGLGPREVYEAFSEQTGVPAFLLRDDAPLRFDEIRGALAARVRGQAAAIDRVAETLCVVKAGLQPAGKPLATFLFVGPTGVGKTELARALAGFLFRDEDRMVRFDMSEFMDGYAAQRLIQGTDGAEGLLTARVRAQPFCVLLLDEIEKAHPAVFDLLLQVLGEGRLSDARGRTTWFQNAIVILTSNLGARHRDTTIGIERSADTGGEHYLDVVQRSFRPEFVNRLDRVIPFSALGREEVRSVARLVVSRIAARRGLIELGLALSVGEAALDAIAEGGYSSEYGARALRRHADDVLAAPLARLIGSVGATAARNGSVHVRTEAEPPARGATAHQSRSGLVLELVPAKAAARGRSVRLLTEVGDMRRLAAVTLRRPSLDRVREHLAFLVAQLNYGRRDERAHDHGRQRAEHHRLQQAWTAAEEPLRELESIEELALELGADGDAADGLRSDARAARQRFVRAAVPLWLSLGAELDAVTLIAQEPDAGRPLDLWLGSLLAARAERQWACTLHFWPDPSTLPEPWPKPPTLSPAGAWPAASTRLWGPPRGPEDARAILEHPERPRLQVVVRLEGRFAGAMARFFAGTHRVDHGHPEHPQSRLDVGVASARALLRESDWGERWLQPRPHPADPSPAKKPDWLFDVRNGTTLSARGGGGVVPPSEVWLRLEELLFPMIGGDIDEEDEG